MLRQWLAPTEVSAFVASQLGRAPCARPGAAHDAVPLLGWQTLDHVLGSPLTPDVLTVSGGQLAAVPVPRSADDVRRLMRLCPGVSTVVRASERHDDGLARLARSFAELLPGVVHVQIYATPAGTNAFGWHYDFEDVFIAQTAGVKDYYFRRNTVALETRLGDAPDFSLIREERSQLLASRLEPGDWLYIPRRWWHLVRCVEDSLSISIGVMPPETLREARRIPAGW